VLESMVTALAHAHVWGLMQLSTEVANAVRHAI